MTKEQSNKLFGYFLENHGISLLESDIKEIEVIVLGEKEYLKQANQPKQVTDEEIYKEALKNKFEVHQLGFLAGAKWMRDQIGGRNE